MREIISMKITVYEFIKHEVHDPYTIVIDRCDKDWFKEMWGMNRSGGWYFSSDERDSSFQVGRHLGKKVPMHNLPINIQKSILNNLVVYDNEK
jgi:hypothetical protein